MSEKTWSARRKRWAEFRAAHGFDSKRTTRLDIAWQPKASTGDLTMIAQAWVAAAFTMPLRVRIMRLTVHTGDCTTDKPCSVCVEHIYERIMHDSE